MMARQLVSCRNEECDWKGTTNQLNEHASDCKFQLVPCKMKDFGCKEKVRRKDLATHMRESELKHLTCIAVLNLGLTAQLQQDLVEKDKKIAQLQQKMAEQRQEMKDEVAKQGQEIKKAMAEERQEMKDEMAKQRRDIKKEMAEQKQQMSQLREQIQQVHITTQHIMFTGGLRALDKVFTFYQYYKRKHSRTQIYSEPFYSHQHGYMFKLSIWYAGTFANDTGAYLHLLTGKYDDQLPWPVRVKVRLELLNQAGDHHHVEKNGSWRWEKYERDATYGTVTSALMNYSDLERRGDGVQYMMNDCLKIRLLLIVQAG